MFPICCKDIIAWKLTIIVNTQIKNIVFVVNYYCKYIDNLLYIYVKIYCENFVVILFIFCTQSGGFLLLY
jgi:choline kinase